MDKNINKLQRKIPISSRRRVLKNSRGEIRACSRPISVVLSDVLPYIREIQKMILLPDPLTLPKMGRKSEVLYGADDQTIMNGVDSSLEPKGSNHTRNKRKRSTVSDSENISGKQPVKCAHAPYSKKYVSYRPKTAPNAPPSKRLLEDELRRIEKSAETARCLKKVNVIAESTTNVKNIRRSNYQSRSAANLSRRECYKLRQPQPSVHKQPKRDSHINKFAILRNNYKWIAAVSALLIFMSLYSLNAHSMLINLMRATGLIARKRKTNFVLLKEMCLKYLKK